jgi:signal-transduction protein with cAMP-binding, CBS, and nucleotidyltransferase domain
MDKIRRYMHEDILAVKSNVSAKEAACVMRDNSTSSLLVMENNDYVGIITHRDMSEKLAAEGLDPNEIKVASLMNSPLITLDASLPMDEALLAMKKNGLRHIVATVDSKVAGILSITDFAHYHSLTLSDPVSEFWSNSEDLLDKSTSMYALDKLLKGMADKLGDESKTTRAIRDNGEVALILERAMDEGLQDFADALKIFTEIE